MTEPSPRTPDRARTRTAAPPRRRKPSAYPVVAASLAAFMALFGFLAYQLRTGHDPALGNKPATAQLAPTKRVILKRIEDRIIVTRVLPPKGEDGSGTVQLAAVPASSAPSVSTSGPVVVQSAPAPAPAAPVVTRTS